MLANKCFNATDSSHYNYLLPTLRLAYKTLTKVFPMHMAVLSIQPFKHLQV